MPTTTAPPIDAWLATFTLDAALRPHVAAVVGRLPSAVRDDLLTDPHFLLGDYETGPGGTVIAVALPRGRGAAGRSVVLRRTLRHGHPTFVRWVIAHELAHAHLRNKGRWPGDDPEHAADALAAEWGFPKPPAELWPWGRNRVMSAE